jgi:hypothetical protein
MFFYAIIIKKGRSNVTYPMRVRVKWIIMMGLLTMVMMMQKVISNRDAYVDNNDATVAKNCDEGEM